MKKIMIIAAAVVAMASAAKAQETVIVGGEKMYPTKDIVSNAVNSKDHTTLVAAVKAAGLVEALQGKGPLTVFAPTNSAFDKLPKGTVENLLKPENKGQLTKVLTYHVVSGNYNGTKLMEEIKKGNGSATLTSLSGGKLTVKMNGPHNIMLTDENGNTSNVTISDVNQSNGVIHVIDAVVLPRM